MRVSLALRGVRIFLAWFAADEYHVTGGLCMAGGGETCCAFRSWMLSHKVRRRALELRFHRIEKLMVFGRVTVEKLQSASLS